MKLLRNGFRLNRLLLPWTASLSCSLLAGPPPSPTQRQHPPALVVQWSNPEQLLLTVTNGTPGGIYELQRAVRLGPGLSWSVAEVGQAGQTNFLVSIDRGGAAFFKARLAFDWDSDGVENWRDAQPDDPQVGLLTVTIIRPAHGSVLP